MTEFLTELAALTLGGSAAIIVLALTARLSRAQYAARWRCWVWLLLCARLAIPVSIQLPEQTEVRSPIQITAPSDTVIYTYEPEEPQIQQPLPQQPQQGQPTISVPNAERPSGTDTQVPAQKQEITLYQVMVLVWAVGAVTMLGWYCVSHMRFLYYLRRWGGPVVNAQTIRLFNELGDELDLNRRPELYVCTGLSAPMLVGLFRPKLLLPEGNMGEEAMRYSILHELTHFKRRDIWLKGLALLVNAIHWFNPFMWYMMRLVERDTELACDEAALKKLSREEHGAYGKTILDAVQRLKSAN